MTIRESEDLLFSEWRKSRPRFVADGALDQVSYQHARLKLLFLLKEVNDEIGGDWDLRDIALLASQWQTWSNVARWTFGLVNNPPYAPWITVPEADGHFRDEWLRHIVAVNLKKTGGGSSADKLQLIESIQTDREFLRKQLNLYKPDVTICCGTGEYLPLFLAKDELGEWLSTSNGTVYARNQLLGTVVSYYHPQARYPRNFLYTMLVDAVKEMLTGNGVLPKR
jgi:hypothetical protein